MSVALTFCGAAGTVTSRRLRPETVGGQDWHNDYARLTIALRQALERAPDDATRKRLLAEMERLLG